MPLCTGTYDYQMLERATICLGGGGGGVLMGVAVVVCCIIIAPEGDQ